MSDGVRGDPLFGAHRNPADARGCGDELIDRHLLLHELRTPLACVLGMAQLMRLDEGKRMSDRASDWLAQIELAGTHMLQIVDVFGARGRCEATRALWRHGNAELVGALRDSVRMMSLAARKAGVELCLRVDDCRILTMASETALRQVFVNLISNAIKYTARGGRVDIQLDDDALDRACQVTVVVRDNGLGMSPDQLALLFEPYQRVGRERGRQPGSGLGLFATRLIVEALGARLEVDSVEGIGTCVRVLLPLSAAVPGGPQAAVAG